MTKHILKWLWNNTKGYRLRIILSSLIGILSVLFGLTFIYTSKLILDIATGETQGDMIHVALFMLGLIIVETLLDFYSIILNRMMNVEMQNRLRYTMFNRLLNSEWKGKEKHHSGDMLNRIERDVTDVAGLLLGSVPSLIITSVQFIASFFFLYMLDSRLALTIAFIMPVFLVVGKIYMKKMRQLTLVVRNSDSEIQSVIQESIQHRMVVKTLNRGTTLLGKLGGLQSKLYGQVAKRTRFSAFSNSMVIAGFSIGYLIAFLWGAFNLSTGVITFGVMGAFLQLVGQIQRPIVDLSQLIPSFVTGFTAGERIVELEKIPLEKQGKDEIMEGSVGLRIENISFAYSDKEKQLFKNFSFDFPPLSNTAILGETGAGKTSLIRLMLALTKPQSGDIVLYNSQGKCNINPLTRNNFVYVPQGNTLFSGTIRENLLMGDPNASEEKINEAIKTAIADFVYDLPDGLDTVCGERGAGLSEGQAQRVAIARALLRPGKILLLDEATSALDVQTEEQLLTNIHNKLKDKTIIFITHRLSITSICDKTLKL